MDLDGGDANYVAQVTGALAVTWPDLVVTDDPAQVSPPCLHIGLPQVTMVTKGQTTATMTWPIWLLAPHATVDSKHWLLQRLGDVMAATGVLDAAPSEWRTTTADGVVAYPAYNATASGTVR